MSIRLTASALIGFCCLTVAGTVSPAIDLPRARIDITDKQVGQSPKGFLFWRTGSGEIGNWRVVNEPSATTGFAIEQSSIDQTDDRYPMAVYEPISAQNYEVSARIKIVSGRMQSAGIALRVRNELNYYLVRVSALEERVDLFRVIQGKLRRITGVEAPIGKLKWHRMDVLAANDQIAVALDDQVMFRVRDRTFLNSGHVALWTEEDNVTRFEEISILPLESRDPNAERRR